MSEERELIMLEQDTDQQPTAPETPEQIAELPPGQAALQLTPQGLIA